MVSTVLVMVHPPLVFLMLGSHEKFLKFSCNGSHSFFVDHLLFQCWTSQANPLIFFIFSISSLFIFWICFQGELFSFIFSIDFMNVLIFNFQNILLLSCFCLIVSCSYLVDAGLWVQVTDYLVKGVHGRCFWEGPFCSLFCLCFPQVLSLLVSVGLFHVTSFLQISGDPVELFFLRALK